MIINPHIWASFIRSKALICASVISFCDCKYSSLFIFKTNVKIFFIFLANNKIIYLHLFQHLIDTIMKKVLPLTISWPATLVEFIKGPVKDKTRIKPAQLTELAMEQWLKDNGYWEQYQATLAQDIL